MTIEPYIKKNKVYFIKKTSQEPNEHFNMRCNFIASQEPKTQEDFNKCTVYSHIFINNTLYGAMYNDVVMNKLIEMKKKIYDK